MVSAAHIRALAEKKYEAVRDIRRHMHQYPELSFEEYKTSEYICRVLDSLHIPYTKGFVKTGIVAHIEGKNPSKKVLALRADMDALPITEMNQVAYKSKHEGVMHACGHDVHSASLLGTAMILCELREHFEGTVKLIFQPGEEVLPGGASLMIKEHALKNPDATLAIAQHVFPSMETGKVGFRAGMYMASTDEIHITVKGKGGHAAMAGDYINPLVSAAEIITKLQQEFPYTIDADGVARNTANHIPTVLAFGKIEGKGATNVIPDHVQMAGTFRTMDEAWRKASHEKIKEVVEGICAQHKTSADINIIKGYPFLTNNETLTNACMQAAKEYLGADQVEELPIRMTAEDFAYISQEVPSCFYRLGTGNTSKGITSGVHTATFDIDEDALKTGSGLMAWLTITQLNS